MEENKKSTEAEQIKRIANDIANICPDLVESCCGQVNCVTHLSLSLFKEGYRNKSDVVREIYEGIRKTLASMEYKTNTSRKTVRVEELIEQMDWVLHCVVPCAISEVLMKYERQESSDA